MTTPSTPETTAPVPQRAFSPVGGVLSYLVPGLGQIYQGRVAKGVFFLVALYALFFYGMFLGSNSNVYLRKVEITDIRPWYWRWDPVTFLGQLPIGVVAWPAVWQYLEKPMPAAYHDFMRTPPENRYEGRNWRGKSLNELQSEGDKFWDLGWVYTVIAGVLNILVIYDAYAGPAFMGESEAAERKEEEPAP